MRSTFGYTTSHLKMTPSTKRPVEIPAVLGVPLLLVMGVFAIPYLIAASVCMAARERRLFRRLRATHRTLPWREVEQHLQTGSGTLIIEQAQKQSHRLWWTPDDVASSSPVPVPAFAEIDFVVFDSAAPFTSWCFERYLSPSSGTALLTRSVGLQFPPGFIEPGFFIARFPLARVIATKLTH